MTPTPRTDAAVDYTSPEIMHRLCKELERELAAKDAQFRNSKAKHALDYISRICGECGHTMGHDGDGCANCLKAEIATKNAQIVALREALESSMEAWRTLVNSGDAGNWNPEEDAHIIRGAKALSTPAPPVVPMADVKPLLDALQACAAVTHPHGPYLNSEDLSGVTQTLAAFTAKHPAP